MNRRRARKVDSWTSAAARRLRLLAGGEQDIKASVVKVASRYLAETSTLPTDLDALGRSLNVVRIISEDLPISGELRRESDGFVVVYSSSLGQARRRFTIAHEIAHAVFETSGRGVPRHGRELERICDMLATEFLMPIDTFRLHCGHRSSLSWEGIAKLADLFRTSLSATSIRCAELMGVTVFEVEDDCIVWGYGEVRKGPVSTLDTDLIEAIQVARNRPIFDTQLYARIGNDRPRWWDVQSKSLGKDGRMLLLMKHRESHPGGMNGSGTVEPFF